MRVNGSYITDSSMAHNHSKSLIIGMIILCLLSNNPVLAERFLLGYHAFQSPPSIVVPSPTEPGSYHVGVRTATMVDYTRFEVYGMMFRTFPVEIWYPCLPGGERNTVSDMIGDLPNWAWEIMASFYGDYLEEILPAGTSAYRDAEPDVSGAPYPVIIFSHGNQAIRFQNYTLCEHLASHGFVVVAPDHYANAVFTNTPTMPILYNPMEILHTVIDRLADCYFLYGILRGYNNDNDSFLRGMLSLGRLGITGHSYGGTTAMMAGYLLEFVDAIAPMNPVLIYPFPEHFGKPFFLIQGELDGICDYFLDSNRRVKDAFMYCESPLKVWINMLNGGHYSATDACFLFPPSYQEWSADCSPSRIEPALANEIAKGYITAFFKATLCGEEAYMPYLEDNHYPGDLEHYYYCAPSNQYLNNAPNPSSLP